jgi:hypothetical protein
LGEANGERWVLGHFVMVIEPSAKPSTMNT